MSCIVRCMISAENAAEFRRRSRIRKRPGRGVSDVLRIAELRSVLMVQLLGGVHGIGRDVAADAAEGVLVHGRENRRRVCFAVFEFRQLSERFAREVVGRRAHRQRNQHFVRVQTGFDRRDISF